MAYDSQHLTVESSTGGVTTHILPARTGCIVNNTGLHYNTKYWHEPHLIEPRRWLTSSPNTYDPLHPNPQQEAEINAHDTPFTANHVKGSFMTFNEGPRACLGKRFAQVEFVAFYARLLKQHRLVLGEGEDGDEMERVIRLRSGGSPVTLVPPMDVKVRLEER
jgi:cytochrome P450